jgi:hypothetical protein
MAVNAVTGWLEDSYGFGLSPYTHDDEHKMLSALAESLAEQDDETAQTVVNHLVDKVHNAEVWASLMRNPKQPAALCRVLFPAFESGTLLAHPDTFSYAATLLNAAAQEGSVPHHQLETAVRRALDLVDQNGRSDHVKDVLVGCLDHDAISDESIAAHRERLADTTPEIPAPPSETADARPWSPIDYLLKSGVVLEPEVESAARDLHRSLNELNDNKAADPDAIAQLADLFALAYDVFSAAESTPSRLQYLLVDAASRLARAKVVSPEHPRGPLVVRVLAEAARSEDAGSFLS